MIRSLIAFLLCCVLALPARAGTACSAQPVGAQALAAAANSALRAQTALEQADEPLALVARVGTDLNRYGLVYSHVGFVLRDHADGRWTVVHLLNHCGSDRSGLYAEGLVNFFADDLVNQDLRLIWLQPDLTNRVLAGLQGPDLQRLHEPHYSVIARPDSRRYQNSTAWVAETLAAAQLDGTVSRPRAQNQLAAQGFHPDVIHIAYGKRVLGGLFAANAAFSDHPISTRLSGEYPVVTVRSILRWLEKSNAIRVQREWRHGEEQPKPGPA